MRKKELECSPALAGIAAGYYLTAAAKEPPECSTRELTLYLLPDKALAKLFDRSGIGQISIRLVRVDPNDSQRVNALREDAKKPGGAEARKLARALQQLVKEAA